MVAVPAEKIETTPRARALSRLRAYYEGTQYAGRPDFWTGKRSDGTVVPVRERAPCVVYPLPKAVVNQATRFTFGEGRFPRVCVEPIKADAAPGPGFVLSKEEAAAIEAVLAGVIEMARLRPGMRTWLRGGLTVSSGPAILSLRNGRFCAEYPRSEHCWPTFSEDDPSELESLTWCFRFNKLVEERGELVERPHFFRRDVTTTDHVVFDDAPIETGKAVSWRVNETASTSHRFGFCPARWCRNLAEEFAGGMDGVAIYEGLEDEFDALNLALSQRHRGINYWGSPQPWESGVAKDDGPAPAARTGATARPRKGEDSYAHASGGGESARAVAVDEIWTYENPEAQVGLLETTGKAFESATLHVNDIRGRILEAVSVVLHDPEAIGKGEISGKAIALLFAPLLGLVDDLHDCWWPWGLRALLELALRMIAVKGLTETIFLPRVGEVAKILQRFRLPVDGRELWVPPPLTPIWGRPFSPSEAEVKTSVEIATAAKDAGLITNKTAAGYVADDFGVQDVEAELEEAEEESLEAAEHALEQAEAAAKAKPPEGPPGGDLGKVAGDVEAPGA
jgi:hypothetical protein